VGIYTDIPPSLRPWEQLRYRQLHRCPSMMDTGQLASINQVDELHPVTNGLSATEQRNDVTNDVETARCCCCCYRSDIFENDNVSV